jgi:methylmalonyl-CoA carboxyltransferase large subunit
MSQTQTLEALVADLQAEVRRLNARLSNVEAQLATRANEPPAPTETITEEDMLAISAAVAAFLGVRAHVRQVRLIHTDAWAQVGRVNIQAAHGTH